MKKAERVNEGVDVWTAAVMSWHGQSLRLRKYSFCFSFPFFFQSIFFWCAEMAVIFERNDSLARHLDCWDFKCENLKFCIVNPPSHTLSAGRNMTRPISVLSGGRGGTYRRSSAVTNARSYQQKVSCVYQLAPLVVKIPSRSVLYVTSWLLPSVYCLAPMLLIC